MTKRQIKHLTVFIISLIFFIMINFSIVMGAPGSPTARTSFKGAWAITGWVEWSGGASGGYSLLSTSASGCGVNSGDSSGRANVRGNPGGSLSVVQKWAIKGSMNHPTYWTGTASVICPKVDSIQPTIIHNGMPEHCVGDVTKVVNCTDAESGCASGNVSVKFPGSSTSQSATVADNAGNRKTETTYIRRYTTKPSCSTSVTYNSTYTEAYIRYSCSSSQDSCSGTGTKTSNGSYGITCKNSCSAKSSTVYASVGCIDKTPPACSAWSTPIPSGQWTRTSVPAGANCSSDSGNCSGTASGCAGGSSGNITSNTSFTVWDRAGNSSSCTAYMGNYDITAPTISIDFDSEHRNNSFTNQTSDPKITVTVRATDGQSGVDRVCYKLTGATTTGDICQTGNSVSFDIVNNGQTTISAWSGDKAVNHSSGNNFVYAGGNVSHASRVAYIDRTKPTLSLTSRYDTVTQWNYHNSPWVNFSQQVNITGNDYSGISSFEWIWSLDGSNAEVVKIWGGKDQNKPYDRNGNITGSFPITPVVGESRANTHLTNKKDQTSVFQVNNPTTPLFNDEIYLHVRVCDNAVGKDFALQPNCSTGVYGPIRFDNIAPDSVTVMRNNAAFNEANWTSILEYTVTGRDFIQSGKKKAGLDTIEFYFDVDYPHSNTNKDAVNFSGSAYSKKENCNYAESCSYVMNYNGIYNIVSNGQNTSKAPKLTDGVRWMGVKLIDKAGNVSKMFVNGPYLWDTTRPTMSNIFFSQDDKVFEDIRE